MKTRIITAICALIVFLPLLFLGGEYFKYTTLVLGAMASYEVIKMTFKKSDGLIVPVALAGAGIYVSEYTPIRVSISIIFLVIVMFLSFVVFSNHKLKLGKISALIFLTYYIFIGFYSLYILRGLGLSYVFYLLLTMWVTDSMEYFGGMKFGKRKLSPNISPNKSIEGSIIGSVSSVIIAVIFYYNTNIFSNLLVAIIVTLIVSIIGQFGDLIESAYKRESEVKDSSNILPGHGGIFDRFDSAIIAAPCLLVLLSLINNI